ncbi:MAG: adenylyl-sulfate kinase, partial [Gammaproteobacteria bacterium]|nr:adenylyl-sulfate kinase [Gammaproteobacteria bacterium]MBU0855649.1 adenylyl-sulfate kinase [Gammaproteobacteria bacterium]
IILVDARHGVQTQTRRHSFLVSLIGIKRVVVAINKMDLVGYSEATYRRILDDYRAFAAQLGLEDIVAIPMSALRGDNITEPSEAMGWYHGPTLMGYLETVEVDQKRRLKGVFRLPVQWVNRPNLDFRGFAGTIAGGSIEPGAAIRVQPSGRTSTVKRIVTADGDLPRAIAGQSVTLVLEDEVDISRGDVISSIDSPAEVADQFETTIVWMQDEPMMPGRAYLMKVGSRTVSATVSDIKYKVNVNTLEHLAAKQLALNEIAVCTLSIDRPIAFDPYDAVRETGGFILIDRISNATIGAGMLRFALRRSHNIHMQHVDVDKATRGAMKGQKPCVLWFTGLSGAGKSTLANQLEKRLNALGRHTYLLDGDNVRHGLNKDLGFTEADRVENIRRVAEVAKLMVDAGLIVLTAFISPFRSERRMARALQQDGEFIEIFVDTPMQVAEERDPKGLYKKARRGEIKNFTGIDSPYEAPENAEIRVDTSGRDIGQTVEDIMMRLRDLGILIGD